MKTLLALFLCLAAECAFAALLPGPTLTIRSRSDQFIVHGAPPSASGRFGYQTARSVGLVPLEPNMLAVTGERVKEAVLRELGLTDHWRGKIHLILVPAVSQDQKIVVASTLYQDGWQYRVELPSEIAEPKLMRALVQVLLLEIANRNSRLRPAEMPLWLTEGFTHHLLASVTDDLLVQPGTLENPMAVNRTALKSDPLRQARERLRARPAMTFNELSWPAFDRQAGEKWEIFQSCAQLFVSELLRLPDGRAALRQMFGLLPQVLNWQTAFLRAYRQHFGRLLDVEKWWAVNLVNFTGRDQWQALSAPAALQRLDDLLLVPVAVRNTATDLPARAVLTLQAALQQWDYASQQPVLRQKINQLLQLRLAAPAELVPLLDDYRLLLESYLSNRTKSAFSPPRGQPFPSPNLLVRQAVKRLNVLDARRDTLRRQHPFPADAVSRNP